MKTMNILKVFAAVSFAAAVLSSCTKMFEDYNTNKHGYTDEELEWDNLRTGGLFAQMVRRVIIFADGELLSSDYQIVQNLIADTYAGYTAPSGSFYNGKHTGSYTMINGWCRAMYNYKYTGCMSAYTNLMKNAEGNEPLIALANIVKVAAMHTVTDYYGPIPYSKVGQSLNAEYDSQEEVYHQMLAELDDAIDVLNKFYMAGNTSLLSNYDIIYDGNITSWIKFANSLRLRLAMRLSYVEPALAKTEAEKSVAGGVMEAVADAAIISHDKIIYDHPIYTINYEFNDGDCEASAAIESFLSGYKDPRLAVYVKPAADGKYHGMRQGVQGSVWDDYRYVSGKVSPVNIASKTPLFWMYASEIYFLRAEGALRGWNMGGTAKALYEQGIKTSFEERSVNGADTYITDNTSKPADYVDNVASNNASATTAITIAYNESADFETNLERIITQKWIAMFPLGTEAWAEVRRTGYPKLFPAVVNDAPSICPNGAKRVPYDTDEAGKNPEGYAQALAKLGGPDTAGTKLWWDKK